MKSKKNAANLIKSLCLGGLISLPLVNVAQAATVEWSGAIANSCVVTLSNHGSLGVSVNGQMMSSEQVAGLPARVAVMSTGANVLTISSPSVTLQPANYVGSPIIQTKHSSNKGHAGDWKTTPHQASIEAGDAVFDIHAQLTDASNAFPMGLYKVSSEVTCSPN